MQDYPIQHLSTSSQRFSYRSSKGSKAADEDDPDDRDDEADADMDVSEMTTITFAEDAHLPNTYRELKTHLRSTRLDAIVGAGLSISRGKVDDIFLASKLRLNGERVLKKSKQLKEGDYVDVLMPAEEGQTKAKRIRVVKIIEPDSENVKLKVFIRAWRNPVSV